MSIHSMANAVTTKIGRTGLKIQKQSPAIMFATGVAGVVTTVVLASRATLKLDDVLNVHEDKLVKAENLHSSGHPDYSDSDYSADKTKIFVQTALKITKVYGPAFIVGVASVGCLTGAHVTLNRRYAGAVAAYAAVEQGFREYRERVLSDVGADKDREYRYGTDTKEIYSEKKNGEPVVDLVAVPAISAGTSIYARFFDPTNANWNAQAEHNLYFLKMHQTYLNQLLQARGHVFLNEAYDALDLPRTKEGQIVGWLKDSTTGDNFVDFGIWDDKNMDRMMDFVCGREDCILVDFNVDGIVFDKI